MSDVNNVIKKLIYASDQGDNLTKNEYKILQNVKVADIIQEDFAGIEYLKMCENERDMIKKHNKSVKDIIKKKLKELKKKQEIPVDRKKRTRTSTTASTLIEPISATYPAISVPVGPVFAAGAQSRNLTHSMREEPALPPTMSYSIPQDFGEPSGGDSQLLLLLTGQENVREPLDISNREVQNEIRRSFHLPLIAEDLPLENVIDPIPVEVPVPLNKAKQNEASKTAQQIPVSTTLSDAEQLIAILTGDDDQNTVPTAPAAPITTIQAEIPPSVNQDIPIAPQIQNVSIDEPQQFVTNLIASGKPTKISAPKPKKTKKTAVYTKTFDEWKGTKHYVRRRINKTYNIRIITLPNYIEYFLDGILDELDSVAPTRARRIIASSTPLYPNQERPTMPTSAENISNIIPSESMVKRQVSFQEQPTNIDVPIENVLPSSIREGPILPEISEIERVNAQVSETPRRSENIRKTMRSIPIDLSLLPPNIDQEMTPTEIPMVVEPQTEAAANDLNRMPPPAVPELPPIPVDSNQLPQQFEQETSLIPIREETRKHRQQMKKEAYNLIGHWIEIDYEVLHCVYKKQRANDGVPIGEIIAPESSAMMAARKFKSLISLNAMQLLQLQKDGDNFVTHTLI